MSDKFFFKGRQDARQSHIKYGFETKAAAKSGSKKHPLELLVTNEDRKAEIEKILEEKQLFANITIDTNDDAVEAIEPLTILLNKVASVKTEKTPARNEPCSCGSGKKFKKCCG